MVAASPAYIEHYSNLLWLCWAILILLAWAVLVALPAWCPSYGVSVEQLSHMFQSKSFELVGVLQSALDRHVY